MDKVYTSGRYLLGIGQKFERYPLQIQNMEYSSKTGADEYLIEVITTGTIRVEVTLQYQLKPALLGALYKTYAKDYKSKFIKIIKSEIVQKALQFEMPQFYLERRKITEAMSTTVKQGATKNWINIKGFQMQYVRIPVDKENLIVQTAITKQKAFTALETKKAAVVKAQILVIKGKAAASIREKTANQNAQAFIIKNEAAAFVTKTVVKAQQNVYPLMKQQMGLTNAELLRLLWINNLNTTSSNTKMMIGFDSAKLGFLKSGVF